MSGAEFTAGTSVVISGALLLVICWSYSGYRADNLRDQLFTPAICPDFVPAKGGALPFL